MYFNNIYRAELCLTCQICDCDSLQEIGEFLDGLSEHLEEMEEAGIAIGDHDLLKHGKITFETEDPVAAELLDPFPDSSDDDDVDDYAVN